MRLPSKITSYKESVLSKFPPVLNIVSQGRVGVLELYLQTKEYYEDIREYIDTLDCLYALGCIDVDKTCEVIYHVT